MPLVLVSVPVVAVNGWRLPTPNTRPSMPKAPLTTRVRVVELLTNIAVEGASGRLR